LLQPLQERHEIPDSEDMILHEPPQILDGIDFRVNGMIQQLRAKIGEAVTVLFLHVNLYSACLTLAQGGSVSSASATYSV
jgi:hypothetical protein